MIDDDKTSQPSEEPMDAAPSYNPPMPPAPPAVPTAVQQPEQGEQPVSQSETMSPAYNPTPMPDASIPPAPTPTPAYLQQPSTHREPKKNTNVLGIVAVALSAVALIVSIASMAMTVTNTTFTTLGAAVGAASQQADKPDTNTDADTSTPDTNTGADDGTTADGDAQQPASIDNPAFEGDTGGWHYKLTDLQKGVDADGNPMLIVSMDATNNTGQNDYPYNMQMTVFQNGKSVETTYPAFDDPAFAQYEKASGDLFTEIQNGATVNIAGFFKLEQDTGDVELQVQGGWDGQPMSVTVTL